MAFGNLVACKRGAHASLPRASGGGDASAAGTWGVVGASEVYPRARDYRDLIGWTVMRGQRESKGGSATKLKLAWRCGGGADGARSGAGLDCEGHLRLAMHQHHDMPTRVKLVILCILCIINIFA